MKIEVSTGELVDKVSILSIKLEMMSDEARLANVRTEYELLLGEMAKTGITVDSPEFRGLREVNLRLWNIEDRVRLLEARGDFGREFIECARSVYRENDKRAAMKRRINLATGSRLIEEKEYTSYGTTLPE